MKIGIGPAPSDISLELIAAAQSGIWVQVMVKLCQRIFEQLEKVLERRLSEIMAYYKTQFCLLMLML